MPTFEEEIEADAPSMWAWLNDSGSVAEDHTGNGHDAEIVGSVTRGAPSLAPGLPGKSLRLNADGYVKWVPGSWDRTPPFTAEIWFKWQPGDIIDNAGDSDLTGTTTAPLFGVSDQVWLTQIRSFPDINAFLITEGFSIGLPDTEPDDAYPNQVHQAVLSVTASQSQIWLDGTLRVSTGGPGPFLKDRPADPLLIGTRRVQYEDLNVEHYHFRGWVQHAMIFDHELTTERVYAHWVAGITGQEQRSLPPRRLHPREDGRGVGNRRIFPPPASLQDGRRTGGATYL